MNLSCIGISHKTAPVEDRERLWFSADEIRASLPRILREGITEAVLFSTCNRTELYILSRQSPASTEPLIKFLQEQKSATDVSLSKFFTFAGQKAVEHLFSVTSGIDSMVIGDVQILAQVKEGLTLAQETGTAGFYINKLFQAAFHTGKRSRSETRIGEGAVSVSYAAVELAEKIFERFEEKKALVIGAGEMAQLTAKHLRGRNIGSLYVTNRTPERSQQLAAMVGGTVLPFEEYGEHLNEIDILVSSVSADRYILNADDIRRMNKKRGQGALCIIDIGVPRNIDPAARTIENVFLHDIDSLNGLVGENELKRRSEIPKVTSLIHEELEQFERWLSGLLATPTIAALTEQIEHIRRQEVEKNINRFDPKDRELVELLTKRIANKILHAPIVNLKNGKDETHSERMQTVHAIRKLFGIEETKDPSHGA